MRTLAIIFVFLLIGLLAGFVGAYIFDIFEPTPVYLSSPVVVAPKPITIERPNSDQLIAASPSLVAFYKKRPNSTNLMQQLYRGSDQIGGGVILTNDGWIVGVFNEPIADKNLLVSVNNQILYPAETVINDTATDLVFIKINQSGLTPVAFANDLDYPSEAWLHHYQYEPIPVNLKSFDNQAYYNRVGFTLDVNFLRKRLNLANPVADEYLGMAILNNDDEVLGIVSSNSEVIPVRYFVSKLNSLFGDQTIDRRSLAIKYLALSELTFTGQDATEVLTSSSETLNGEVLGAYITELGTNIQYADTSIETLQVGDIIIKVDNEFINQTKDLSEVIQEYFKNDTVKLEFLREGKKLSVDVMLN